MKYNNNNKLDKRSLKLLIITIALIGEIAWGDIYNQLLPNNRIVAYYGSFKTTKLGVLGEYPRNQMLDMLNVEVEKWKLADPNTPVIPAFDYITTIAHKTPMSTGNYLTRDSSQNINEVIDLAKSIDGLVFLDLQIGSSRLEEEIPLLKKYLMDSKVHLALDPEFAMKNGAIPGKTVGQLDATEINYAIVYLSNLVRQYNLPPKILVIHRYNKKMVTNYQNILTIPEVQVVINMDGWGTAKLKKDTYKAYIQEEPVQFSGFKLFYKNDTWNNSKLMQPKEILKLSPNPVFIVFQ